jgi:hypothetical protein
MTRLTRSVRRETAATVRGRELMVELSRLTLTVRQKGKRVSYTVPLDAIFDLGAKLAARAALAEKRKAKPTR